MRAGIIEHFGAPDVVELGEVARPEPGEGEVLVRVAAAGVGPWDAWVRSGKSIIEQALPLTLGSDIAGSVQKIGRGVTGFAVGEHVYGVTNARFTGGYAEFAVARAVGLAPKPRRLTFVEAASVPVVAVTALQMLFDHARCTEGDRVLVLGAGGNVGAYALQLARNARADVVGSDVGLAQAYARTLGIGPVIGPLTNAPVKPMTAFDIIIDAVGGDAQRLALALLKPGGRLVSSVTKPDASEAARLGVHATFMLVEVTTSALVRIAKSFDSGALVSHVGTVLPLTEARAAHAMLDGQLPRAPGKIVLEVADGSA